MTMPSRDEALAARTALVGRLRENMPLAMRERAQWLLWRFEDIGRDKPAKVPYWINGRRRAGDLGGEDDRKHLASFDDALQRYQQAMHFTGVGFAFLADDGLVGIDLDATIGEGGELREHHLDIIEACASYTERSPSGTGVHIICTGKVDSFKHDPVGIEVYAGGRYFACTGDHWSGTPQQAQVMKPYALAYLRSLVEQSKDAARAARAHSAAGEAGKNRPAAPAGKGQGSNDFKRVNELALNHLKAWVPQVLPGAHRWQAGYRVTSKALGRELQEDLQLLPDGIYDFGEEHPMSAIDVVMQWRGGCATPKEALHWLAPIVGVQLEQRKRSLQLVRPEPPAEGQAVADERPEPPPPPSADETDELAKRRKPAGKAAGGTPRRKGGGGKLPQLLRHYALIRGTSNVWDGEGRTVMEVKALRLLFGNPAVNEWLAHPERELLLPEQIRFEPGMEFTDGTINLFDGLPTEPKECAESEVAPMLDLLRHLCSLSAPTAEGCQAVMDQVLKWCALMVQKPGAKLRFALVFHGPQGAGKNMFFDAFRRILGKYGKMVGQAEIEDRFNGYMSGKLLLVANEVMTRAELFHGKNKLKWVITEDEIPIRGMHQETRWESNHANVVFLSNENRPVAIEQDDRRHLVVYTPAAEQRDLYLRCADFIADDGPAKFMYYLQRIDLDGFNEYTRPLMTQAKKDLILLGMEPQQRFAAEWLEGLLDLPLRVCSAEQLFRVYERWARSAGIRWPGDRSMFTAIVKRFVFEQRDVGPDGRKEDPRLNYQVIQLKDGVGSRKAVRCWVPHGCEPPPGIPLGEWAWPSVEAFEPLVRRFGRESFDEGDR